MATPSTGPAEGFSDRTPDRAAHSKPGHSMTASGPAESPNGKVIYVNSAQVKAAQLLVDLSKRRKEAVDPAVAAIANAKRVNGYAATAAGAAAT